ncbi:MAG: response regulator [Scytonematopsis contorta HA4267-MV1]|nr:response regulator [Scytonematopsis contorta HA4267-MV1]
MHNFQPFILIVDDNLGSTQVLLSVLEEAAFTTLVAKNGESALEKLEAISPDIILLDVMMPGIDGFETCRRIQQNPANQGIPIIFMTALSDTEDKIKGLHLGAVDYITKPFQQEEVLAKVRTHLKLRQLTKTLEERNLQLKHFNETLEDKVAKRTARLSESLKELQAAQLQLVQSEKMSTLGQLIAGIGHEINNPLGSLYGNLVHIEQYIQDLLTHIHLYQVHCPNPAVDVVENAEKIDLDFLEEDLPQVLAAMKFGTERIEKISNSLRTFSRQDDDQKLAFDLHCGIDSTLMLLQHRLKANNKRPEIKVIKEYGELPLVHCFSGQINQVFMNLLANAVDALEESNQGRSFEEIKVNPNQIIIKTELSANSQSAVIRIIDNGIGMTDEVRQKIFDYLFTTKGVGKGTGLGLAITHQIIIEKHGGMLEVNSKIAQGTEFVIKIPLQ